MPILALLRGLVVVRRSGENGIDPRPLGNFFGFFHGIVSGVRCRARQDGYAPRHDLDSRVDHVQPFIVHESRRLARGSAGNQKIYAGLHLPRHQIAQGSIINRAILMKRSDQRGTTATELHGNKIARMGLRGNGCQRLKLPPHILEIVESLLAGEPFGGAECAVGEALA